MTDPSRVLYIAEPIDQSDYGQWKSSVAAMVGIATKRGWLCYRPANAWRVEPGTPIGSEIEFVNRQAMASSAAVLAHLPDGVRTVGVPREIEWATMTGRPVLVVTERVTWSLHDVDTCDVGDSPAFGQWLERTEAELTETNRTDPVAFTVDVAGTLPTRANPGDAGFDLYVSEDTKIEPGEFVDVPCGVRVAMPPGIWGRITGRSSTWRKRQLLVIEGVIDTGYRGPLYAGVTNMGDRHKIIEKGERIAQLVLHENVAARHHAIAVDSGMFERIPGDGRGEAGFGSSGV